MVDPFGLEAQRALLKTLDNSFERGSYYAILSALMKSSFYKYIQFGAALTCNMVGDSTISSNLSIFANANEQFLQSIADGASSQMEFNAGRIMTDAALYLIGFMGFATSASTLLGSVAVEGTSCGTATLVVAPTLVVTVAEAYVSYELWAATTEEVISFFKEPTQVGGSQGSYGKEGGNSSEAYQAPNGGGGITSKINVNGKEITFGHGGRHLEGTGLNLEKVNNKLAEVVSKLNLKEGQFYKGRVNIDGITIEFTSYGVSDSITNIGTYYTIP